MAFMQERLEMLAMEGKLAKDSARRGRKLQRRKVAPNTNDENTPTNDGLGSNEGSTVGLVDDDGDTQPDPTQSLTLELGDNDEDIQLDPILPQTPASTSPHKTNPRTGPVTPPSSSRRSGRATVKGACS